MSLLAAALAQAHLAQCRHSLCNPIVKSNNNVQTRPQQHRCFYLALLIGCIFFDCFDIVVSPILRDSLL
jgi:hypothetical protein